MSTTPTQAQRRRASRDARIEFYASCPAGFEQALAAELRAMDLWQVRPLKGRVAFVGSAADGMRACLWSRLASRVFALVGRFMARDAEELYEGVYGIAWEDVLRAGATIAVAATGVNDALRNTHFTALRAKDAICDRLADKTGARATVDTERPDARLLVSLRGDRVSLHIDLAGEPLFRRMPRMATRPDAPAHFLRPDYAALLLTQAGWAGTCRTLVARRVELEGAGAGAGDGSPAEDTAAASDALAVTAALVDPCCAGGGVALEAAYMLVGEAPGERRRRWGFMGWGAYDAAAWMELLAEAREHAELGARLPLGRVLACDLDGTAAAFARRVVDSAQMGSFVQVCRANVGALADALAQGGPVNDTPGCATRWAGAAERAVVSLAIDASEHTITHMQGLLALVGEIAGDPAFARADVAALTRNDLLGRALGGEPNHALAVRPGNEDATVQFWRGGKRGAVAGVEPAKRAEKAGRGSDGGVRDTQADREPDLLAAAVATVDVGQGKPVPVLVAESSQFANRLKKNARARRKWARREGVTCYRVYDADLPDYAAAIDLYEGAEATPGRWLVIAEYAAPKSVDAAVAQARFLDILALTPRILDVPAENVHARARTRARGGSQYAGGGKQSGSVALGGNGRGGAARRGTGKKDSSAATKICEGGLTFEVNFDDYLDTGIFLDHRVTRDLVRSMCRENNVRWFLNLFAYTGTATCYAADAGVQETVTVDLSNTYLDWAERNMAANGFTGSEHHYVRDDVLGWMERMRYTNNRWDLIFCDPPTFSNSSKMGERTWDVQRDHVDLLRGVTDLLTPGGTAVFSCNLRGFRPNRTALAQAGIELTDITERTIPEDFARNKKIHHCYLVRRA